MLTHAPLRGATCEQVATITITIVSTHAPLRGATRVLLRDPSRLRNFYSRASARRDSAKASFLASCRAFLLTHLLRGATGAPRKSIESMDISTHAPLARCDWLQILLFRRQLPFLLTHLLRGATAPCVSEDDRDCHFYSRTSCEVRRTPYRTPKSKDDFYSRTSCEVRPAEYFDELIRVSNFYSRTSCEVRLKSGAIRRQRS